MTTPAFGLFAFGPQAAGVGDTVSFDYFTLDGQDPAGGGLRLQRPGDEFDGPAGHDEVERDRPARRHEGDVRRTAS